MDLQKDITFLRNHERLIFGVLIFILVLYGTAKIVSHLDGVAHDQSVLAQQQVKDDLEKSRILGAQTLTDKQALQTQLQSLAASNTALQNQLVAIRLQLADQRGRDSAMAPDALSGRWATLMGISSSEFQTTTGGILASVPAAHETVSQLEEIPTLRQELKSERDNGLQKDITISKAKIVSADQDSELSACKKTVADQDTSCKRQITDLKNKARKKSAVATIVGFIGGILLRSKL